MFRPPAASPCAPCLRRSRRCHMWSAMSKVSTRRGHNRPAPARRGQGRRGRPSRSRSAICHRPVIRRRMRRATGKGDGVRLRCHASLRLVAPHGVHGGAVEVLGPGGLQDQPSDSPTFGQTREGVVILCPQLSVRGAGTVTVPSIKIADAVAASEPSKRIMMLETLWLVAANIWPIPPLRPRGWQKRRPGSAISGRSPRWHRGLTAPVSASGSLRSK